MCADFAEHCNTAFLTKFEKFHIVEVMVRVEVGKTNYIAMQMAVSRPSVQRNFRRYPGITGIFHYAHWLMMRVKYVVAKGLGPKPQMCRSSRPVSGAVVCREQYI